MVFVSINVINHSCQQRVHQKVSLVMVVSKICVSILILILILIL